MKIKPIILSGGSGLRLWPLSRENKPKEFFDIFNNNTNLFEQTIQRVNNVKFERPLIISNKNHWKFIESDIKDSDPLKGIILLIPIIIHHSILRKIYLK